MLGKNADYIFKYYFQLLYLHKYEMFDIIQKAYIFILNSRIRNISMLEYQIKKRFEKNDIWSHISVSKDPKYFLRQVFKELLDE